MIDWGTRNCLRAKVLEVALGDYDISRLCKTNLQWRLISPERNLWISQCSAM